MKIGQKEDENIFVKNIKNQIMANQEVSRTRVPPGLPPPGLAPLPPDAPPSAGNTGHTDQCQGQNYSTDQYMDRVCDPPRQNETHLNIYKHTYSYIIYNYITYICIYIYIYMYTLYLYIYL